MQAVYKVQFLLDKFTHVAVFFDPCWKNKHFLAQPCSHASFYVAASGVKPPFTSKAATWEDLHGYKGLRDLQAWLQTGEARLIKRAWPIIRGLRCTQILPVLFVLLNPNSFSWKQPFSGISFLCHH